MINLNKNKYTGYYLLIILLIVWHLFVIKFLFNPKVNFIYDYYYVRGSIDKWNRGVVKSYSLGDYINFKKGGNSQEYSLGGFSNPEKWGTWTSSNRAYIIFNINQKVANDVNMILYAIPFVNNKNKNMNLYININNVDVIKYQFESDKQGKKKLSFIIKKEIINKSNRNIIVELIIDKPISPMELSLSNDFRKLGIGIECMCIK